MAYKSVIGGGGAPSRSVIRELEDQHLSQIATSDKYQFIVPASCVPRRAAQNTAVTARNTALGIKATELCEHVAPAVGSRSTEPNDSGTILLLR
jgi:hypothetical protein